MDVRQEIHTEHLPSKLLIKEFLNLYRTKRQPDRESYTNMVKSVSERVVTGEPVSTTLDNMVKAIEKEIDKAETWDHWYNLILMLRHKGNEAQTKKTQGKKEDGTQSYFGSTLTMLAKIFVSDEDSLLFETFHLMANLIIRELNDCPFEKGSEDEKKYVLPLNKRIAELEENRQTARLLGEKTLVAGKSNETFLKTENECLLSLAYLGDTLRINDARKHALLTGLKNPTEEEIEKIKSLNCNFSVHEGVPLCLQPIYVEFIFEKRYRELEGCRVSFDQFKTDIIAKETRLILSKVEEQRLLKEEENKRKQTEQSEKQRQRELTQEMKDLQQQRLSSSTASGTGGKEPPDPVPPENGQPVSPQAQPQDTLEKTPSGFLNKTPAAVSNMGHFAPADSINSQKDILGHSLGIAANQQFYPKT